MCLWSHQGSWFCSDCSIHTPTCTVNFCNVTGQYCRMLNSCSESYLYFDDITLTAGPACAVSQSSHCSLYIVTNGWLQQQIVVHLLQMCSRFCLDVCLNYESLSGILLQRSQFIMYAVLPFFSIEVCYRYGTPARHRCHEFSIQSTSLIILKSTNSTQEWQRYHESCRVVMWCSNFGSSLYSFTFLTKFTVAVNGCMAALHKVFRSVLHVQYLIVLVSIICFQLYVGPIILWLATCIDCQELDTPWTWSRMDSGIRSAASHNVII